MWCNGLKCPQCRKASDFTNQCKPLDAHLLQMRGIFDVSEHFRAYLAKLFLCSQVSEEKVAKSLGDLLFSKKLFRNDASTISIMQFQRNIGIRNFGPERGFSIPLFLNVCVVTREEAFITMQEEKREIVCKNERKLNRKRENGKLSRVSYFNSFL